jgi:hypothetical protein
VPIRDSIRSFQMRVFLDLLVMPLLLAAVQSAQTSPELHARYGEPNQERFVVRPGTSVSAEYGSDHAVCRFTIEPIPQAEIRKRPVAQVNHSESQSSSGERLEQHTELNDPPPLAHLPIELAEEVLEELIPGYSRGEGEVHSIWESGGSQIRETHYSNVSISRLINYVDQKKPEVLRRIIATFKRDACQN